MPSMNAGHAYICYKTDKQIVFKWWATVQLYAETNCHGWLKMTVNGKQPFPQFCNLVTKNSFTVRCRATKANCKWWVEQFRHYIILTCQVSFIGPFLWTSWEGVILDISLVTKKTSISKQTFKNPCISSLSTHYKFPCDGGSFLLWLHKHQAWHLSHNYLKFTKKYWNFWKHCCLEFTPVDVSWERGLGSERISMGHILLQNWLWVFSDNVC